MPFNAHLPMLSNIRPKASIFCMYNCLMVAHSNIISLPLVTHNVTIVSTKFQVYTLKPSQVTTH